MFIKLKNKLSIYLLMDNTLCPLDNRYADKVNELLVYFSYKDWIEYRLFVYILSAYLPLHLLLLYLSINIIINYQIQYTP